MPAVDSAPPRLVVADDHGPTRLGLRRILEDGGFEVVAEASDAAGAVDAARHHAPELCLLDVRMPGGGITAAASITALAPETTVVMLTVSDERADLFASLQAGAVGFLPKDMNLDRLPAALHGALDGEAAIPRRLVRTIVDEFRGRRHERLIRAADGDPVELTEREWEILEQLRAGMTTAQIANDLDIRRATVRSHVSTIMDKLSVSSRNEVVRLASRR